MGELEKKKLAGLVMTLVIVVFIAVYWANEPARQAAASERILHESMTRGAELYRQTCVQCHGQQGQGVVGPALKGTGLDEKALEKVISRGVPQSAMPAWGQDDGGPFKTHQVQDLVNFIKNWDQSLLEGQGAVPTAPREPALTATATPTPTAAGPSATEGQQLFSSQGCSACHGASGEGSPIAPALKGIYGAEVELATGTKAVADAQYLKESLRDPNAKVVMGYQPGLMPRYDLSDRQMDDLIEFLKGLK